MMRMPVGGVIRIATAYGQSMVAQIHHERARHVADFLAIAVALALPWSTSATAILIGALLVALLISFELTTVRTTPITLAGLVPALLWALAVVGMLWAAVGWADRLEGMRAYHKLLLIPLLLLHFSRSKRGWMVPAAYLLSCGSVLVVSLVFAGWPALKWHWSTNPGVPIRDRIAQSGEFVLCAIAALALALHVRSRRRYAFAVGLVALAALFLFDVVYVANSRTSLVVGPLLVIVLGARQLQWRGAVLAGLSVIIFAVAAWFSSPYLRDRVMHLDREIDLFARKANQISEGVTSAGERLEYWNKAVSFIRSAPIVGHGTGSMPSLFRRSTIGRTGLGAIAAENPHNQTLAVAIDLGLVGAAMLWSMWIVHLLLLRGPGLANTLGLFLVIQNIVSSVFNSHLTDFSQGWTYVFGIGVFGGMALANRRLRENPGG